MSKAYSIIIPAYNDADGLKRHFEFFQKVAQTIQLIVIDDCSTDGTSELCKAFQFPANIKLTYRRFEQNRGPAAARNLGIGLAQNELVMFLDADDILADTFFSYIGLAPLAGDVDFVIFKHHLVRNPEERFSYDMHHIDRVAFSKHDSGFPIPVFSLHERPEMLSTVNFPWNKLYRRSFLIREKILFPDMRMHEDIRPHWHSFLRCRKFGIFNWAPPLITHFEIEDAQRATNYRGEERIAAFNDLPLIIDEILNHPEEALIRPVFKDFLQSLFDWLVNELCAGSDVDSRKWRKIYTLEIMKFKQNHPAIFNVSDEE